MGRIDDYVTDVYSWDHFDWFVDQMPNRQWIFRGQSNANWQLESSLYRTYKYAENITKLGRGKPKKIARKSHEKMSIQRFMDSAHLFLDYRPPEDQILEWLAIMQHYGAPTRLCDFTFSPYVAAYFALEDEKGNAAIYCVSTKRAQKIIDNASNFRLEKDNHLLYIFEPRYPTHRLMAQQGVFLVPGTLNKSHDELINNLSLDDENRFIFKLKISPEMREGGLQRLRKYNINSSVLFPGLEGFCKTFKFQGLFRLSDEERIGNAIEEYPEGS
ncbi:MAG: FRG domain-containing protein [Anaerolineales bacterium]|nr:FRG domain-containing protein [Anaerolineales bacterium]